MVHGFSIIKVTFWFQCRGVKLPCKYPWEKTKIAMENPLIHCIPEEMHLYKSFWLFTLHCYAGVVDSITSKFQRQELTKWRFFAHIGSIRTRCTSIFIESVKISERNGFKYQSFSTGGHFEELRCSRCGKALASQYFCSPRGARHSCCLVEMLVHHPTSWMEDGAWFSQRRRCFRVKLSSGDLRMQHWQIP